MRSARVRKVCAFACKTAALMVLASFATAPSGHAAAPALSNEQLAEAFGALPSFWEPSLSPDGSRAVMVAQPRGLDLPVAMVHDFRTGKAKMVLASRKDKYDLRGCLWANDDRLICRFYGIGRIQGTRYGNSRVVAVNADGSDMRVLMQARMRRKLVGTGTLGQYQGEIIDRLPDEPDWVLIREPDKRGTGLSRMNIHTGKLDRVERTGTHIFHWITDADAEPRVRLKVRNDVRTWQHRAPGAVRWKEIWQERPGDDHDDFSPIGFGDDRDLLYAVRRIDGRMALVREDQVGDRDREVMFAHDEIDVGSISRLGPHRRLVGAEYVIDRPHVEYFDPAVERVVRAVGAALPGRVITVTDESWDRKIYLIFADSDVDPGTYYRLDVAQRKLDRVQSYRPALSDIEMSPMKPIRYRAADGTEIPGYVTRPVQAAEGPLPTIVLPHGGPQSRDTWGFDYLTQFLVAKGFVVFQTNYRGSFGYGEDWIGDGAYKEWRRVVSDIDDGLTHLIEAGVTDPDRVCAVGWSFGGYASLLSVIEHPARYRCVVDIAGVSDPGELIDQYHHNDYVEEFVGTSAEVLKHGSPLKRAKEFTVPVLIFHPEEDLNVYVEHGRKLAKALKKAGKTVEYIEYEDDEHSIWRHASRIDMLTRIGAFLDEHLAEKPASAGDTASR